MMKKIGLVFFLFIAVGFGRTVFAEEETWIVKVDGVVNMRSEPTTDSLIVYQLKDGMKVEMIEHTNQWSYLFYDGVKGYLKNEFLHKKEKVDTHVKDFFYHTMGYEELKGDRFFKNLSFIHNVPQSTFYTLNRLKESDEITAQIIKTTKEQPLKGKKIVLDPGHGGNEAGASYHGVKESDETLALGLILKDYLVREGATVVMTVDENFQKFRRMSLRERASFAKRYDADLFVSLHFNTNENPYAKGTETYYNRTPLKGESNPYPDESERLANYIQRYLISSIETEDLGTKDDEYHVLRNNTVPSVLIEVAFLSNPSEVKRIQSEKFKHKSAYGITQGIIHYFR